MKTCDCSLCEIADAQRLRKELAKVFEEREFTVRRAERAEAALAAMQSERDEWERQYHAELQRTITAHEQLSWCVEASARTNKWCAELRTRLIEVEAERDEMRRRMFSSTPWNDLVGELDNAQCTIKALRAECRRMTEAYEFEVEKVVVINKLLKGNS